jgi:hypothetical protein
MLRLILETILVVLASSQAAAAVLCVNPGGTGGCFSSIQGAVDAAGRNDVIEIGAGTYEGQVFIYGNDRPTLRGAGAESTILDMTDAFVLAVEIRDAGATIEDLSIINTPSDVSAIRTSAGRVVLRRLSISGSQFAGVYVAGRNTHAEIIDSKIEGNESSFGVLAAGARATVRGSTITGNRTGVDASQRGAVRLEASTVSGNEKGVGVGGDSPGERSRALIRNSTITANDEGMIFSYGRARMAGTIVAGNAIGDCRSGLIVPYANRLTSQGFNIVGSPVNCLFLGQTARDLVGVDPLLGPLQDNGGPTETHALLPGSPAESFVTRAEWCRDADQRGVPRTTPCDAGAFELP